MTALASRGLVVAGRGVPHGTPSVDGVSFEVEPGEIVAVVGARASGKTSLLRALAGDVVPAAGVVTLDAVSTGVPEARRRIGFARDPDLPPSDLTGTEWLGYLAAHRGSAGARTPQLVRWSAALAGLGDWAGRRVGRYDRERCRRLAVAAVAVAGPRMALLDETLTGADTLVARELQAALSELAGAGRVVVVASGDVSALERVATRALVLSRGRIAADVHMSTLVGERVAELALSGGGIAVVPDLVARFPGSTRTGEGVAVPLANGLSLEAVLSACRTRRIAVAGSRVRYRMLEDILTVAARQAAAQANGRSR